MHSVYCFHCVLCALLLVQPGTSQLRAQGDVDYLRSARASLLQNEKTNGTTYLEVEANFGQGPAVISWYEDGTPPILRAQTDLPFHRMGTPVRVAEGKYLLSGLEFLSWDPAVTRGVICKAQFLATGSPPVHDITISGTCYLPTLDPIAITWNIRGKKLFLLDHKSRELLAADWPEWTATLPSESSLEVAADPSAIPLLVDGREILIAEKNGDGCYFLSMADLAEHWQIQEVDNTWQSTASDQPRMMVVRHPGLVSSQDAIVFRVNTPALTSWTLNRETDGQLIASGEAILGQWTTVSGTSQAFHDQPGVRYILEVPTQHNPIRKHVYPSVRYGLPQGTASFRMSRVYMPLTCEAGDSNYGHGVFTSQSIGSGSVSASLWIAVRNGQYDPVTVNGSVAVLLPQSTIDFHYDLATFPTSVGLNFPILNDSGLIGSVILWQYVFVLPGGAVAFTEVFGTRIVAAGSSSGAMSSSSVQPTLSKDKRLQRAWASIGATPKGELPLDKRLRVGRLRSQLLRRR